MAATTRRRFLAVVALAGGGFAVGCALGRGRRVGAGGELAFVPDAWIRILPDDRVIVVVDRVEMGQGTATSTVQLVAEELEVEPAAVTIEFAPSDHGKYANTLFRVQATGGSTSTRSSWRVLRRAGAGARELLKEAAAQRWGVSRRECVAQDGAVIAPDGRRLRYGELTAEAAGMVVHRASLKEPRDFKVIGRAVPRVDAAAKADGSAQFSLDVVRPGLVHAVVLRSPVIGGRLSSFDAVKARALPGVVDVLAVPSGVAVVASTFWQASKASGAVAALWDEGALATLDTEGLRARYAALAAGDDDVRRVHAHGDVDEALAGAGASQRLRAVYELPYLSHAPMEPLNCVAEVTAQRCDVWVGHQSAQVAHEVARRITGLEGEQVFVHTTYLGGGFGRRAMSDFVAEAVEVAKRVARPVKVTWTRTDDVRHGWFRPMTYSVLEGAVGDGGVAWKHRLVGQSVLASVARDLMGAIPPEWLPHVAADYVTKRAGELLHEGTIPDVTTMEGAARPPYAFAHARVEYQQLEPGVPVGFWRSVGHSGNAFVVEGFVDELAHLAKRDPFEFRRSLLTNAPRHLRVLELAAAKAGWGTRPLGIAQHESFKSYVALVVEASVDDGGAIRVHRVVCAVDCGTVVNPDVVRAQMEGGILFGLSAALWQEIHIEGGRVRESNFHDYRVVRMPEAPVIETHIVASDEEPTGVGEVAVPVVAPALANALFAATGVRLRKTPLEPALRAARAASATDKR